MAQGSKLPAEPSEAVPPSLDKMVTSARASDRKARRAFQRIISGLHRPGQYRLLTLTSSDAAPRDVQASWHILINRLRRLGIVKAYIKVIESKPDARSHIHVIIRGSYIEQTHLSSLWASVHLSPVVDIRKVEVGMEAKRGVARYLCKYLSKQLNRRISPSSHWLYPGACHAWRSLVKATIRINQLQAGSLTWSQVLSAWHVHLSQGAKLGNVLKHLALHQLHWYYYLYAFQHRRAPRVIGGGVG